MVQISRVSVFLSVFLVMPISGFAQSSGLATYQTSSGGLTVVFKDFKDKIDKSIEIVSCRKTGGSWECIMKNKTNMRIDMHKYFAAGYDNNDVKADSGVMFDILDANSSTRISFARFGSIDTISKVVITER